MKRRDRFLSYQKKKLLIINIANNEISILFDVSDLEIGNFVVFFWSRKNYTDPSMQRYNYRLFHLD